MLRMDPFALRAAAEQLKHATDQHAKWHENLLRSIFCELPSDPADLAPSAHRHCPFGQWFYEHAPNGLRGQETFAALGKEHQRLHQVGARLLHSVKADVPISRGDFEDLVATSARMREHVEAMRLSIEAALGNRDALTGAYGRVEMLPELNSLHAQTQLGSRSCCIVFMDVDQLKQINDMHGHPVGDAVLAGVVRHVNSHLRPDDRVFRYGGDEFLIALPGADLAIAQAVIARVQDSLANQLMIAGPQGSALRVSASFGLALLDPEEDVMESVNRADQALLLAKTAGRNRAIAWDAAVVTSTHWRRLEIDEVPDPGHAGEA